MLSITCRASTRSIQQMRMSAGTIASLYGEVASHSGFHVVLHAPGVIGK